MILPRVAMIGGLRSWRCSARSLFRHCSGEVVCKPAFDLTAEHCRQYSPERVEAICGVGRDQVEAAAQMLWEARPVAYYAWSGVEMQTNSTQIARAIAQLSVLTGSFDAPGGNVLFSTRSSRECDGL